MNRHVIEIDGREHIVLSQAMGDTLWLHFNGETLSVPLRETKGRRSAVGHDPDEGEIMSPMPGKVTQVLCKIGDQVKKGQTLLVMEAMKMEYNLKASADGEIEAVDAKPGDQVVLGKLLIKIKEAQ